MAAVACLRGVDRRGAGGGCAGDTGGDRAIGHEGHAHRKGDAQTGDEPLGQRPSEPEQSCSRSAQNPGEAHGVTVGDCPRDDGVRQGVRQLGHSDRDGGDHREMPAGEWWRGADHPVGAGAARRETRAAGFHRERVPARDAGFL